MGAVVCDASFQLTANGVDTCEELPAWPEDRLPDPVR